MTTQADTQPWQEMLTEEQRRFLNAICADLSRGIDWFGARMDKDDWRHFLAGNVLGWRMVPGYDDGAGKRGFVMLGGSSLKLRKAECVSAITMGLHIGDDPEEQGLKCDPVHWSDTVLLGLGLNPNDFREAA